MDTDIIKHRQPDEDMLRSKRDELDRLSELLAEKEMELAELRLEFSRFERTYYFTIGIKYVELDQLKARLAEIKARRQPMRADYRRDAARARTQAQQSASAFQRSTSGPPLQDIHPPSAGIRTLYRRIAAEIHPDKTLDEHSRQVRTLLMAQLNNAYSMRDETAMKAILKYWRESPESVEGYGPDADLARLLRRIAQVRGKIQRTDDDIFRIKSTDLYLLMIKTRQSRSSGFDLLKELSEALDAQLQALKQELADVSMPGQPFDHPVK